MRWICPVCKAQNVLTDDRCSGCHLPTKNDPKTIIKNINEAKNE